MAKDAVSSIKDLDEYIKKADKSLQTLVERYEKLSKAQASGDQNRITKGLNLVEKGATTLVKRLGTLENELNKLSKKSGNTEEFRRLSLAIKTLISDGGKWKQIIDMVNSSTTLSGKGMQKLVSSLSKTDRVLRQFRNTQKEVHRGFGDMIPTVQRLASAFGVAFSVRGLAQFGKKLIETRGEFEMQFVAMKQIIGDVDAATKIWNQTMQQALQSPFKAMQLVTYTKQLAAYRIETEKLFDTTKRLADISAGLGVDMGRLILAFGQVKSANFLRASEVRQFTEAGVNIVGNLAQYFTELEGRAVSTADVMERITKRMVMFSDVEEIFRRMTDEGGEFYKMQEVQANTVKGQIAKLHDAYDQMLNTIGQANQGTLRKYIESLNELVRNWRTVASFIMKNVNAMVVLVPLIATYRKGAKMAAGETFTWSRAMKQLELELAFGRAGIKKFSLSTALGTAAVYTFKGAVELTKMALRTFVPFIAIEGLMWLVTKMGEADRNAKELAKSLDEVGSKNAASLQENIDGFTDLVERLKQANEGSQDYLDIRNKIQSQYGEYLDNLELEQITVENLAKSYDKVVERMREKSRQHIMEEGLQEIADAYGDALVKFQKELRGTKLPNGMKVNDKEAADIAKKMYDLYSKDEFYRSDGSAGVLLGKTLRDYYGISGELNLSLKTAKDFQKAIESRYKSQIDLETKANALTKATSDTHKEYLDQLNAEEEHEKKIAEILADASIKSSGRRELAIQSEQLRYEEKKLELQAQYQKKSDEWLKNEKAKLKENYGAFLNAYNEQVKAYVGGRFGEGWMQGDNSDAWKAYNFMIANQDRLSQGQTKWEEKILNDKKLTEENIKRIKEQQSTQTAADSEAAKALNESLKQEEDRLELIKKQMELLGLHEKQKGGSGSANNSIYGERIRLLQDMLQKYKQLAKEAYGYAKAEGKVSESFEDAWNSIMPVGYGDLEVPTSYKALAEMLQRLEAFTPAFDKNGQLSKMLADLKKAVSDALSQVDIELSVRIREDFGKQMEKAFNDYELTLDIEKLNLPSDVLADMFDIETVDLSDLRNKVVQFYEERAAIEADPTELVKQVEGYYKKIDDMERKQQRERIKEYAKYLEYELSERAKIEMEYVRKSAEVETTRGLTKEQRDTIDKRLKKERDEKLAKQEWEDFKSSETYIQMMEDLEHQGVGALEVMRQELERIRANAANLSPRALKEVVNALEKINEITIKRGMPIGNIIRANSGIASAKEAAIGAGLEKEQVESRKAARDTLENIKKTILEMEKEYRMLSNALGVEKELARLESERTKNNAKMKAMFGDTFAAESDEQIQQRIAEAVGNIETSRKNIAEYQEQAKEADEETLRTISTKVAEEESNLECLLAERGLLEEALRLRLAIAKAEVNRGDLTDEERKRLQERVEQLEEELKKLQAQAGAVGSVTKSYGIFGDTVQDAFQKMGQWGSQVEQTFESFKGMMQALGTDVDTDTWDNLSTSFSVLGTATSTAASAAAKFAAGDYIGASLDIIKGLMDIATQIAELHDKKIDRSIEKSKERVDDLQKAYERLEKQIEKTFDTVSYMREFNKETQNLYEQIEEANRQIAAAQDYKSDDKRKEAIDAAEDAKQQALDALEEIKQEQIEVFGGIGEANYRSAAEGFVDAWKSAFLDTGDGLQGLQDHFDEFLNDWFVKQATMRVTRQMLEPLFKQIDDAVDQYGVGGTDVFFDELSDIRKKFKDLSPQLSDALEELAGMWGLGGEGSLSGLAAGIQGMTEEQANVSVEYLNSVRGYTASIDVNVARIASALGVGGESPSTNPMLNQLTTIANNTGYIPRIYDMLSSASTNEGNGRGFRSYQL